METTLPGQAGRFGHGHVAVGRRVEGLDYVDRRVGNSVKDALDLGRAPESAVRAHHVPTAFDECLSVG